MSKGDYHATKSVAMGVLPLNVPPESTDAFQEFSLGTYNILEICVVNEVIIISKKLNISESDKLQEIISEDDAR